MVTRPGPQTRPFGQDLGYQLGHQSGRATRSDSVSVTHTPNRRRRPAPHRVPDDRGVVGHRPSISDQAFEYESVAGQIEAVLLDPPLGRGTRRSVGLVDGERYRVTVDFEAKVPVGSMGRRLSKFELLLPGDASVHVVKESPDEGVGCVEVELNSAGPAMALRDVARAIELVSVGVGGRPEDNPMGDVRSARVDRIGRSAPGGVQAP
jgi:hypothetical protein